MASTGSSQRPGGGSDAASWQDRMARQSASGDDAPGKRPPRPTTATLDSAMLDVPAWMISVPMTAAVWAMECAASAALLFLGGGRPRREITPVRGDPTGKATAPLKRSHSKEKQPLPNGRSV